MKKQKILLLPMMMLAISCSQQGDENAQLAVSDNAISDNSVTEAAPATSATPEAPATADFSIDTVPVSNAPLGKFPYFGLPENYGPQNTPKAPGFGHFTFWTGKAFQDVEGETYMVTIVAPETRDFRSHELRKNMQALFQQAGAVKVHEGRIPKPMLDAIPDATRQELGMGFGDIWNDPVETWVIRRPDGAVWIHYTTNSAQASLAVVQAEPFVPTASLLPVDQLKSDLDKTGKAVIHVNFATNQATILPTSKAQLDAVVALLKGDPSLTLAINGYTDDTGTDAHNVTLSDYRARAVQATLVAAGVNPQRLQAKGYGRMNPVSSNTDEAGKAANRRVELVKL